METQNRRGMACGNITCLETKIGKLEEKETLTEKEQQTVSKMAKKLEALSAEFKTYHCAILDQTEDLNKLANEQVLLDDPEDKVEELMECLEDQVVTSKPVTPQTSGTGDHRSVVRLITEAEHFSTRMNQIHGSLMKVKRVVEDKEVDMCLLEGHEERLKIIDLELQGIKQDTLLIDDYKSLAGRAAGLEGTLFKLRVVIKRLLKDIKIDHATVNKKRIEWS